jgi:hypothetical protein
MKVVTKYMNRMHMSFRDHRNHIINMEHLMRRWISSQHSSAHQPNTPLAERGFTLEYQYSGYQTDAIKGAALQD